MQRALQAQQEAELAEAARALLLDGSGSNGSLLKHTLRVASANGLSTGSQSGASTSTAGSISGEADGSGSSSSGSSAKGTGTHTPLARAPNYETTTQPIPLSFAASREHVSGPHLPPPGNLHLSPGPSSSNGRPLFGTNYELGSSFVDNDLSSSPYANGPYSEVLGGKLGYYFATTSPFKGRPLLSAYHPVILSLRKHDASTYTCICVE